MADAAKSCFLYEDQHKRQFFKQISKSKHDTTNYLYFQLFQKKYNEFSKCSKRSFAVEDMKSEANKMFKLYLAIFIAIDQSM